MTKSDPVLSAWIKTAFFLHAVERLALAKKTSLALKERHFFPALSRQEGRTLTQPDKLAFKDSYKAHEFYL